MAISSLFSCVYYNFSNMQEKGMSSSFVHGSPFRFDPFPSSQSQPTPLEPPSVSVSPCSFGRKQSTALPARRREEREGRKGPRGRLQGPCIASGSGLSIGPPGWITAARTASWRRASRRRGARCAPAWTSRARWATR